MILTATKNKYWILDNRYHLLDDHQIIMGQYRVPYNLVPDVVADPYIITLILLRLRIRIFWGDRQDYFWGHWKDQNILRWQTWLLLRSLKCLVNPAYIAPDYCTISGIILYLIIIDWYLAVNLDVLFFMQDCVSLVARSLFKLGSSEYFNIMQHLDVWFTGWILHCALPKCATSPFRVHHTMPHWCMGDTHSYKSLVYFSHLNLTAFYQTTACREMVCLHCMNWLPPCCSPGASIRTVFVPDLYRQRLHPNVYNGLRATGI